MKIPVKILQGNRVVTEMSSAMYPETEKTVCQPKFTHVLFGTFRAYLLSGRKTRCLLDPDQTTLSLLDPEDSFPSKEELLIDMSHFKFSSHP